MRALPERRGRAIESLNVSARWFYMGGVFLVGELAVRPWLGLTLSDVLFLVALGTTVVLMLIQRRTRVVVRNIPRTFALGAVLFTIGGLISSILSANRSASLLELCRLEYVLVVWLWLAPQVIKLPTQLERVVYLWVGSAVLASVAAIIQLVSGDVIPNTHIANGRMTGLTQHVNDLGGVTAIALVPSLVILSLPGGSPVKRISSTLSTAVIVGGLLLSGSVTGFAAAAIGSIAWIISWRPDKRIIGSLSFVILLGAFLALLQSIRQGISPWTRLLAVLGIGNQIGDTSQTRLQVDLAAFQAIWHHPLIGVGLDQASSLASVGNLVHNLILEAWLGGGLLAAAGITVLIGSALWSSWSIARRATGLPQVLASQLFGSSVAFVVFAMGAPVLLSRYAWLPVALTLTLMRIPGLYESGDEARLAPTTTFPVARETLSP